MLPGGFDDGSRVGITDPGAPRLGPPAGGAARPELGARPVGAAGDPGRMPRLALSPRCRDPGGAAGRPAGDGAVPGLSPRAAPPVGPVRRPGHRAADRTTVAGSA